jgi:hypothetical protein
MKHAAFLSLLLLLTAHPLRAAEPVSDRPSIIVATGAKGEEAYAAPFALWAANWRIAGESAGAQLTALAPDKTDAHEQLRKALEGQSKETAAALWIVLLGHGSFDGRDGKFNLPGDDLAASELAAWLKPFQRPVIVICGFSASGAFLKPLSAPGRIVVTATRSGAESNYARLGGYLSETIASPSADLDKDGQTSLLEAWLAAAQRTAAFYKNDERLATEHPLLDDNGDGLGTPADWFQGIRVVKKSSDNRASDGLRAHQIHLVPSVSEKSWAPARRAERDALERELAQLREGKTAPPTDEYYTQLEAILLRLARVYREGESRPGPERE